MTMFRHMSFRFTANVLFCLSLLGWTTSTRGDWSEDFDAGDPLQWTFFGEEGKVPVPRYTEADFSQMELRIESKSDDFAAGRYNQYAVWTRTLDSIGDVMLRAKVSALEGAVDFLGNSVRSNNDVFLATNNGEYLAAIDFHDGTLKLMKHDDGLFGGGLLVPNQVEVLDTAEIPNFSPSRQYYLEYTILGSRHQANVYLDPGEDTVATAVAHGAENLRHGLSSVGAAINDAAIGGDPGSGRSSLAAGFDDLVSASIRLPTVSLPIRDSFDLAEVGDLTFSPSGDTMGFVHRGNISDGDDTGVTPDGEYLIHDIPSGYPLSLEFYRIDLGEVETLDVDIGVRTWTSESDGFADDHSFSARVELYDGDTRVDSFSLFEAHGDTLDALDAGPNGEPTNFRALIATQDATNARIVVEAVYGGGNDYYLVSSLAASAFDLTDAGLGDSNLDGNFDSGDLVEVFQAGKYEREIGAGWSEGDWTRDRRFDSSDLVAAFQQGGYQQAPGAQAKAVPESSSLGMLLAGLCGIGIRRHYVGSRSC